MKHGKQNNKAGVKAAACRPAKARKPNAKKPQPAGRTAPEKKRNAKEMLPVPPAAASHAPQAKKPKRDEGSLALVIG